MSFEFNPEDDAYETYLMIDEIKKLKADKQVLVDALEKIRDYDFIKDVLPVISEALDRVKEETR